MQADRVCLVERDNGGYSATTEKTYCSGSVIASAKGGWLIGKVGNANREARRPETPCLLTRTLQTPHRFTMKGFLVAGSSMIDDVCGTGILA